MNLSFEFTDANVLVTNNGAEVSIPLSGANTFQLANGSSVVPPSGKYWHVDMNTAKGGVTLGGTHGPVNMPSGSSVSFYVDNL